MKWQFKGKAPAWARITAGTLMLNIFLQIATAFAIPRWFPIHPDLIHSYSIHFKGGPIYFVQPWLGEYFDYGLEAGFALLGLFVLLLWLNREQLERVG